MRCEQALRDSSAANVACWSDEEQQQRSAQLTSCFIVKVRHLQQMLTQEAGEETKNLNLFCITLFFKKKNN